MIVDNYLCLTISLLTAIFISSQNKFVESSTRITDFITFEQCVYLTYNVQPPILMANIIHIGFNYIRSRYLQTKQPSSIDTSDHPQPVSKSLPPPKKMKGPDLVPETPTMEPLFNPSNLIILMNKGSLPICHQITLIPKFYTKLDLIRMSCACKYFYLKFKDELKLEKLKLQPIIRRYINSNFMMDLDIRNYLRLSLWNNLKHLTDTFSRELLFTCSQILVEKNGGLVIYLTSNNLEKISALTFGFLSLRLILIEYAPQNDSFPDARIIKEHKTLGRLSIKTEWTMREFRESKDVFVARQIRRIETYAKFLSTGTKPRSLRILDHETPDPTLFRWFLIEMKLRGLPFWSPNYRSISGLLFISTFRPFKQVIFWDIVHTVEFVVSAEIVFSEQINHSWEKSHVENRIEMTLQKFYDTESHEYILKIAFEIFEFILENFVSDKDYPKTCGVFRTYMQSEVKGPLRKFLYWKTYHPTQVAILNYSM